MKYQPPYGTPANSPYINGNPSTGVQGSIPPAWSIEHPQREIVNYITDAGSVAPADGDLHQLAKSAQGNKLTFANDVGSSNAVIIALVPVPDAYSDGMQVRFRAAFAPTGPVTLDAGRGSRPLLKSGGGALSGAEWAVGDIIECTYDLAHGRWQLPVSPYAMLYAAKDYFVNAGTGNDANDGLTSGSAFATLQRAQNAAAVYNLNGFNINIHVANGTYGPVICGSINGSGAINYIGNTATPSSVVVTSNVGSAFSIAGGPYTIDGFKVVSTGRGSIPETSGNGIWAVAGGNVECLTIDCGACIDYQFAADAASFIRYAGPITVTGNAGVHLFASNGSFIRKPGLGVVCNIPGAVSIGSWCAASNSASIYAWYAPITGAGNVTGSKFYAASNGVIDSGGRGVNYFPGNSAGTTQTGGQYV